MKIVREQREENNSLLRVTVGEEDYGQAVEKELREYKRKANIPGFRPGMVPMGLVKKMYGKGVLAEQYTAVYEREYTAAALADARYFVSQLLPSLAAPFEQRLGAVVAPSQGELAAGRIEAYLAQMDGYAVTVQRDLPAAE